MSRRRSVGSVPRQAPYKRTYPDGRSVWISRYRDLSGKRRYAKPRWNGGRSTFTLKGDAQRAIDDECHYTQAALALARARDELRGEDRLADAGRARDEDQRPRQQAAVAHPVHGLDAGGDALVRGGVAEVQDLLGHDDHPVPGADREEVLALEVAAAAQLEHLDGAPALLRRQRVAQDHDVVGDELLEAEPRDHAEVLGALGGHDRGDADALQLAGDLQQRATQRSIAEQNFSRAKELAIEGDYYGAIILLKQAVKFAPDHAEAWFLLGSCQDRNPNWRREAAESMQQALSIDPNHVDAMIALGDIYRSEGLTSRAQSCYDDVLKIAPENQQAKSRLQLIKKR